MKKKTTSALAATLGITMLLTSSQGALAAATKTNSTTGSKTKQTTTTIHTLANLNPVKISAKSTATLTDVNILTRDEESILTYTLTIKNGDGKTLDLLDYWSKVKTASGTKYSTTLMTKDKDKKRLSAGSSTTLTFVAKVGKNTKVSDLVFQVIKWDFSQTGYESLKGQFKVPASYLTSTPANQSKTLKVFDTPVKAKVDHVASFKSGDYNYVSVGLNLQNVGYKIFEDPKVKFVIKTSNGASYPLTADPTSTDYKIQPQDNKTLNLMTQIPKSIKLDKIELQLIQDDETAKLSLPIATMQLPNVANKSLAIEANTDKYISIGSGKIAVRINGATMLQSFDEHNLSMRLVLKNTSGTTVKLPKYQFELQTSDGYRLPVDSQIVDNLSLQPLEEKTISLNITIPANVSAVNPQLFMNMPAAEEVKDSFSYPVGVFAIPEVQPMKNMIGQQQFIQTSQGLVGFKLSSLQRLPWSDSDLIAARITIYNPSYKALLLPELTGQLKVDQAKLTSDSKLITTQSVGLLGGNMSTDIYVVSKIPSYLNFSQLQVSLLQKIGDNASEWMQFSHAGDIPTLSTTARGETYTIDTEGRKEAIKVLRSFVYTGTGSDLIYTDLEVTNSEDHQIDLSQFAGAYQASEGQTYKATVSQIETSAGPEEKSIVSLWAKIPKKISTTDMKLIIGEGITDSKLTAVKEVPTGYINAAALILEATIPSIQNNLANLDLFPYTLTIKNVKATLNGSSSVNINFEYNQKRNMDYSIGEFNHKYLFEVVDSSGRTFEKEFTPETDLKLMNSGSASFSIDDAVFQDRKTGTYQLSIYDLFQGQKLKLGTQSFYYYSNSVDNLLN